MSQEELIQQRVARGIALLDRKRPGWWSRIDLSIFNIGSPWDCICGQLYGSFGRAIERLGIDGPWTPVDFGFLGTYLLEAEWRRRIELLRTAKVHYVATAIRIRLLELSYWLQWQEEHRN